MARIEFDNVEQKMEDLRGYCRTFRNPDKNPYRTSELTVDEFNFISGMNYVLSYVTDNFNDNNDFADLDGFPELQKLLKENSDKTIEDFTRWGYAILGEIMTSFIESHVD